ncbi:nuclear pore complex protein NUP98A-like isoform X1 [Musa acuminata AAA Group]|uniref:Nucleoporin autopeptidase n=1 Tax=Musa acuminata subsp. malaccensis TaxID=214687 RepID=A0A804HYY4_MUSAM|nr:PREDICTED: nuclear pore complex protein NUP98A-like isoform X1 [Musa acuminata subsp. malaccensis]XP_009381259.1 PREDICTED: nuclear pore complex protein NUP98A-like isoform X1 [Musa acuminata subsp. malaccensis]
MFGPTNPFGQSSSSSFGSQSVFGQTSSSGNNPFAPKPFGSSNPFGSQTGGSVFGSTSTGVFGQPSTPAFGASSAPAFGSSMPAFGASSTPAFGGSSSSFGGSSLFGQKPAFGSFGSSPSQSSPFGSTFQQTQPAFGNSLFGSTSPFGASSQPAFGATTTPTFGSASTPSFGATTTPTFGATSTPAFGSTATPAFGSTSTSPFGTTGGSFGVSSSPAFGSTVTPSFGAPTAPTFGSSSTPAFGASTAPTFGSPTVSGFGASSTPSFGFGSTPSFGQSASAFGSTPFGASPSPFGAQSSPFGAQATTPTFGSPGFGQSTFGGQPGGTRAAAFSPTPEVDGGTGSQPAGKMESISAMPAYKDRSHEELRWEDYQRGDKGGPNPSGQPAGAINFSASSQTSPFGSAGTFGQSSTNPFSSTTPSNPFALKPPSFGSSGFGSTSSSIFSSPFTTSSSSPFGSTSSTSPMFGAPTGSTFGSSLSSMAFGGTTSSSAFGSTPSIFGSSMAGPTSTFGTGLGFGNTQSSGLFQSSAAPFGQASSLFGQPNTGFQQAMSTFGSNQFASQSTGFGGSLFSSSTPSVFPSSTPVGFGQTAPSVQTPFQLAPVAQTSSTFSFPNVGQAQPASSGGFGSISNIFSQGTFTQNAASQSNMVMQPAPVTNPFGTLPAMPQMSIGRMGSAPSIQYGISSMPVADKPTLLRASSMLVPRHLSQRRIKLPPRKYSAKNDGPRVAFFADDETQSTPKADAYFVPRENPRALIIRPIEQWPPRSNMEKENIMKNGSIPAAENGKVSGEPSAPAFKETYAGDNDEYATENGHTREHTGTTVSASKSLQKENGNGDDQMQKVTDSSYVKISGHRAGKAAIVYEHGADIEALMPKLRQDDYYTEPRIQELAAKERAEPGFCRHVKDFVVGRHGYGSIKFYGETDVRGLDLESIVQFNHREVIVYSDDSKKPPVGQGLNKPAEVTLLNIKCMNKKTGQQYTEGPNVEKYKEMLTLKGEEQGAEFLSFDPVKGEWKFKVKHFSCYEFFLETDCS